MKKSPLEIANLIADAAQKKVQKPSPMDDGDSDDQAPTPSSNKKPKQVAAMKEQEKAKGKLPPKKK